MALLAVSIIGCQSIVGIDKREYDPPTPPSPQCAKYCDDVSSICTGANSPYSTKEVCLATCALMPPGDPNEPAQDNTVACRQKQTELAALGELSVNCPRAGPGGDGICGTNCESYCYLFKKACNGVTTAPPAACEKACGVLKDTKSFDVVANHGGDTLQCRLVHVSNSAWKPDEHCPHARIAPVTEPCWNKQDAPPSCEDYCRINTGICTDTKAVYESVAQCMSVCGVLPLGLEADASENTVGCRKYHSYNAVGDPVTHCPHAGPGGDGHCGKDNCLSYCTIVAKACSTDFATTFGGSMDTCLTECPKVKGSAANSGFSTAAPNGNTLQCRLLHAIRAFADPTTCPSAVGAGDCQ